MFIMPLLIPFTGGRPDVGPDKGGWSDDMSGDAVRLLPTANDEAGPVVPFFMTTSGWEGGRGGPDDAADESGGGWCPVGVAVRPGPDK